MSFSPFGGFGGIVFSIIPVMVILVFAVVIGLIVARSAQGTRQWKRNNDSPVLTVDAAVVTKRADVSHYNHQTGANDMSTMHSSTTYFVTFMVASGDRMEFHVQGTEYGMLVEGDQGKLTFQGTRYLGFDRGV